MNRHSLFTFNFKENLIFCLKLIFLFGIVLFICLHIMPQYQGAYTAALLDKVERLNSIEQPKLVLLGNSNLAFGINSEKIEDVLGMPVVNMGLHGSLGNAFHEEMGKLNVTEGDIYIICHTDYLNESAIPNPALAWITIEDHFELWRLLGIKDIWSMTKAYPTYLKKCLYLYLNEAGNQPVEGIYARQAFNDYGDIGMEKKELTYDFPIVHAPSIGEETIDRINKLNDYLTEQGATLLVAGYPIANGEKTPDIKIYMNFQNELREKLNCPVISDYTDYMFDYEYFFNTEWHLNDRGGELRTNQLIKDIEGWRKDEKIYSN